MGSLSLIPPVHVQGAFLKLGPFVFEAQTSVEAVATSNVEQERPGEATAEREDFYFIWSLDLKSTAEMGPRTTLTIDTGVSFEEHVNRPDLNNSEEPFGQFDITAESDFDPLFLNAGFSYERNSESTDEKFVPAERRLPRKKRQVGTTLEYLWGAKWETERLLLGVEYDMTQERYDADEYKPDEQNEESTTYEAGLTFGTIRGIGVGATYEVEYRQTEFVNEAGGKGPEEETERITLDFDTLELWSRPELTYSIGIQKEYTDGESEGWELTHRLDLTDELQLTPTMLLSGTVSYNYEDNPEDDDITFEYDITLEHELSRRVTQTFSFSREPVDTLGANDDTDTTTYDYNLDIDDFLAPNITASASVKYEINRPPDSLEENIWTYTAGLEHSVNINARLVRKLAYEYDLEDSNMERELLEEHRVTFSLILDL